MSKILGLTLALVFAAHAPAHSFEALALKVLGFSPDGRHFGFIQYGAMGDGGEHRADTIVIDTTRDRLMPGGTGLIDTLKEEAIADSVVEPDKLLALAMLRSQPPIRSYDLSQPGRMLVRIEDASPGEPQSGSTTGHPPRGVMAATIPHAVLGHATLSLTIKKMPWPKGARIWEHEDAGSCAQEADKMGAGFRLTLRQGVRTLVLHEDRTIPRSRHCVLGYNIVEVHAFDRPDGKVVLAVILGMEVRAFEGNDRLFLAVTHVLEGRGGLSGQRPIR